jgi:hypothetical protein
MWMRWFRVHARRLAAATLVALVTVSGVTSLAHGVECHDDECVLAVVRHDPASHSVASGSTTDAAGPLHCVLCHWTRPIRPSSEAAGFLARPRIDTVLLHFEVLGVVSQVQSAQPSLRSPPLV